MLGVFQRQAGAAGYSLEWVFSHPELDVYLVGEALGYAPQQRSAAGKPDVILEYHCVGRPQVNGQLLSEKWHIYLA